VGRSERRGVVVRQEFSARKRGEPPQSLEWKSFNAQTKTKRGKRVNAEGEQTVLRKPDSRSGGGRRGSDLEDEENME